MAKNTSIVLGNHFEEFISSQVQGGRYGSTSQVIRQSLRLLEEREQKNQVLRQALIDGKNSRESTPLDMEEIRQNAKQKAGLL